MAAYELLLLNTSIPQIQAAQSGDTYLCPRELAVVVNSATDAVRITQTGTGNALLVEDSANPDATPFVVTAAGNVGVGTDAPAAILATLKSSSTQATGLLLRNPDGTTGSSISIDFEASSGTSGSEAALAGRISGVRVGSGTTGALDFFTTNLGTLGTAKMRLDSSGNLGLGVTPSAWGSGFSAVDLGGNSRISGSYSMLVANNAYYNGTNWIYKNTAASAYYSINNAGVHSWGYAASGTAGNAITFTQAMTLDASGNLGVGNTNLSALLHVGKVAQDADVAVMIGNGATSAYSASTATLQFRHGGNGGATLNAGKIVSGRTGNYYSAADADSYLAFYTALDNTDTERARITSDGLVQVSSGGSVQIGGTAARATTAGTNRLDIFNGTAPVGTLTNGISIYSSSGEAYVMDAAGNATLFSPHDAETNEWIFKSKHTPTGKTLKIDVEKLLRFINGHFGLDAVHEFIEE